VSAAGATRVGPGGWAGSLPIAGPAPVRPRSVLPGYAGSRGVVGVETGFFPIAASGFPPIHPPAAGLRMGAAAGCGGRVSDAPVGASPPGSPPPHEVAARTQGGGNGVGVATTRPHGARPPRAAGDPAQPQAPASRALRARAAPARWLTREGPEVLFSSSKRISNSGSWEIGSRWAAAARTVEAATRYRPSTSGVRIGAAALSSIRSSLARPPTSHCTPYGGSFRSGADHPQAAALRSFSAMPGGELSRGTRLAVRAEAVVPPRNGKRRAGEERVQ